MVSYGWNPRRNRRRKFESPTWRTILQWNIDSWADLSTDLIKKSIESCALSFPIDGSTDDVIHCFKEGEPCRQGREVLRSQLSILKEQDTNPFEVSDSDVEDASDPHLWIDGDQEGDDQDVDVLFSIYWAIEY